MICEAPACRLCGSSYVGDLGAIPDSDYFAGRVLSERIHGGHLWCCRTCHSMFRHPILQSSVYLSLYESGTPTQWRGGDHRQDLRIVQSIIAAEPPLSAILDVGCGTGDFLVSLPGGLSKFGIEPSTSAAVYAAVRGVNIVARTIEHLPAMAQFDVITIIDVIEHVPDPDSLLRDAYAHISPGGIIIVSTGDPEREVASLFWTKRRASLSG